MTTPKRPELRSLRCNAWVSADPAFLQAGGVAGWREDEAEPPPVLARPVSRTGDVAEGPQFDAALVAGGFVGDVLQGLVVLPAGELFDEEHGGVVEPVFGVV